MADYFKNTELATLYGISEATVRNWVKTNHGASHGLDLVERNGRTYVAKSISNIPKIERLVHKNRKYRNALALRTIVARPDLINIYGESGAYDIVRNLELHHEVPHQYMYFGVGVQQWEESIQELLSVDRPNMLIRTIELLDANYGYIESRMANYKKVNVVDIGVGNAVPVKNLLSKLIEAEKLSRYVAIDFSEEMLGLAKSHLEEWFGDKINYEQHKLDIVYERFAEVLSNEYLNPEDDTLNLVLFLGATPNNFRIPTDAFRTVQESMGGNDLFIYTDKLENPTAPPEWFEQEAATAKNVKDVAKWHRTVFDAIGIDFSLYDFEVGFDEQSNCRYARARFKVALTLIFNFPKGMRTINFEKGDTVTLWRCLQTSQGGLIRMLKSTGFHVTHASESPDHNYILTISEVQPSRWNS